MQQQKRLSTIIDGLLKQVQAYGVKETTIAEYRTACNKLTSYTQEKGCDFFSKRLTDEFLWKEEQRCRSRDISPKYFRLYLMTSLS